MDNAEYINVEFLNEYNRLDKLCKEMYNTNNSSGITEYINDMTKNSYIGNALVSNWDSTLKTLKNLRYIRNQLAHESGALNCENISYRDIVWLKDFYSKIYNQNDPLAILNKKSKPAISKPVTPKSTTQITRVSPTANRPSYYPNTPITPKNYNHSPKTPIFPLISLLLIILAIVYFYIKSLYEI